MKSLQIERYIAQICYYDPQSARINVHSPQSATTPRTLTLIKPIFKGEFLELSNQFKDDLEFTELMHQETAKYKNKHKNQKNEEVLEKAIEIYGIYKTNSFPK